MTAPHDRPTAVELVVAVREWIVTSSIDTGTADPAPPPNRFHARVAANMLSIVERELAIGERQAAAHAERLARLGVADDAELAAAIRSGALEDRASEVRELVWASVRDKLAVANPHYLDRSEP